MKFSFTLSNTLIFLCLFFTILAFYDDSLYQFGMNTYFLELGAYHIYFLQFFTSNFLHGDILHFAGNSLFLYFFGNILEGIIGKYKFLFFFLFIVILDGVILSILGSGNTIGISGFCMGLLAYYTLFMKDHGEEDYRGGITALIVLTGIGFVSNISLLGHASGAVGGIIFYYITKDYLKRKYVGMIVGD